MDQFFGTISPGGSKSFSAGYYSGGTVTCSTSSQFVWCYFYNINYTGYELGINSTYGSSSGATWTCKSAGTYRIRAICNDSIGMTGVGIKKNGSWLFNGMFVNKSQDVALSSGNTIGIVGGNVYSTSYASCVGIVLIYRV